jgi:hypothetical protein
MEGSAKESGNQICFGFDCRWRVDLVALNPRIGFCGFLELCSFGCGGEADASGD